MFIVRAVNHSRQDFLPTYVGLRMLLLQTPGKSTEEFLTRVVRRNALSAQRQSYKRHLLYKNTGHDGSLFYRNASAASPSALLLESYCLELLSQDQAFANATSTYSYRWPTPGSSTMWRYFFDGWAAREAAIGQALKTIEDARVLLVDIASFYPSANGRRCLQQLRKRLSISRFESLDKAIIEFAAEQAIQEAGNSIPVGPPLGHALANTFFTDIDALLGNKYPGRYFRYVDDIALVVPRLEVATALQVVEEVVSNHGLSLNRLKTLIVDQHEWKLSNISSVASHDFGRLRSMITTRLAVSPASQKELDVRLKNDGFNIPLREMSYASKGSGFIAYLTNVLSRHTKPPAPIDQIVTYAANLRTALDRQLEEDASKNLTDFPYASNKRDRRIRNDVSKLLYLYPLGNLSVVRDATASSRESRDLHALLTACTTGNVADLLSYPGPMVRTFGQLWSNINGSKNKVEWKGQIKQQQRDAIANLLLWNVLNISGGVNAVTIDASDASLFNFCGGNAATTREIDDLSYLDEIRSLQIGCGAESSLSFLFDRFDETQLPYIEGLSIAGKYS